MTRKADLRPDAETNLKRVVAPGVQDNPDCSENPPSERRDALGNQSLWLLAGGVQRGGDELVGLLRRQISHRSSSDSVACRGVGDLSQSPL
jgi:hypothetical protein